MARQKSAYNDNAMLLSRYPVQSVPSTIVGLEKWLQELWRAKEQLLERLTGSGGDGGNDQECNNSSSPFRQHLPAAKPVTILPLEYLSLCAWLYFIYWSLFHFLLTWSGLLWIAGVSGLMYLVSKHTQGLQEIELCLERMGIWGTLRNSALWRKVEVQGKKKSL